MLRRSVVFIALKRFYLGALKGEKGEDSGGVLAVVRDGLILDASKEAVEWGVKISDSVKLATRRCPGLETFEFNPDDYQKAYEEAWNVFAQFTPLIEPTDYHQGYLDLTGCSRYAGQRNSTEVLQAAVQRLWEITSRRCTWGGGQDKWIARLSSRENRWIHREEEPEFLTNVSLRELGISEELQEGLPRYGIHTVGDLHKTPDSFLQAHLQLTRNELQHLRFRDRSPVRATFPAPVLTERETLLWGHDHEIEGALHELSERLGSHLQAKTLQTSLITLSIHTKDGAIRFEHKLSRPCRDPELLNRLCHEMLPLGQPESWREIRVTLGNLTPQFSPQADLWQNKHTIKTASERVQKKFGSQAVQSGTDYSQRVPARFAQLVYARRGINLP